MNIHAENSLERILVVRTPENLELTYELAGLGTRSAAYVLDMLIQWLILSLMANLIAPILTLSGEQNAPYVGAIIGVCGFAVSYGYFVIAEWLWSGQTPGKRVLGIRIVKTGGYALTFLDTLLRNLLRVIDFFPVLYGLGLTTILLTRKGQRLGDLLAGTIVVFHTAESKLRDIPLPPENEEEALNPLQVGAIPSDVLEACDEYFRIADEIAPRYRQELTSKLIQMIESTSGLTPSAMQSDHAFLSRVILQASQTLQGSE